MRRTASNAILLALTAILLASCAITKPPQVIIVDSTRVEIRERLVHDTVDFKVPVEVEKIVTRDTSSHLENSLASSDASVSGGLLTHTLATKPQTIQVPVTTTVVDTVYVEKQKEQEIPPPQIIEVEKKLTWWQRFRIGAFFWILGLALIGWRREILWILRKIL